MEKWRVFTLVASFISAILAVICWYFLILISYSKVKEEFELILIIGWFLLFVIAFFSSFLIFFFLFYPFFVGMESGGATAYRNQLIFF